MLDYITSVISDFGCNSETVHNKNLQSKSISSAGRIKGLAKDCFEKKGTIKSTAGALFLTVIKSIGLNMQELQKILKPLEIEKLPNLITKSVKAKRLPFNIKFKEAKTMEEAKKFASDNFGVSLELEDDLFTANMVNKVCSEVSNKMGGIVALPEKFVLRDENVLKEAGRTGRGMYSTVDNIIYINKQNIAGRLQDNKTGKSLSYSKWLNGLVERGAGFEEIIDHWKNYDHFKAIKTMQRCITHEIGHCNHFAQSKFKYFKTLLKNNEFSKEMDDPKIKALCDSLFHSKNHKKNPAEFIADTFALKISGVKLPKEIEDLYIKYGGAPVKN